jgi:hypothetical protein
VPSPSIHRSLCETARCLTMPNALKATGSIIGQDAAAAVTSVARIITETVARAGRRCVLLTYHAIQIQAQATARIASRVTQPCA